VAGRVIGCVPCLSTNELILIISAALQSWEMMMRMVGQNQCLHRPLPFVVSSLVAGDTRSSRRQAITERPGMMTRDSGQCEPIVRLNTKRLFNTMERTSTITSFSSNKKATTFKTCRSALDTNLSTKTVAHHYSHSSVNHTFGSLFKMDQQSFVVSWRERERERERRERERLRRQRERLR
jgi:hypothetical protein